MIKLFVFALFAGYLAIAYFIFRKTGNRYLKVVVAFLVLLPAAPATYKQLKFRALCATMDGELIIEPAYGVDAVMLKGSINTEWQHYLVEAGGYPVVEHPIQDGDRVEYEQSYQSEYGVRRRSSDAAASRYQIERVQRSIDRSILENTFIASDLQTGKELGRKKVLFMSGGALNRLLSWKTRNNINSGGYTCPNLASYDDLLGFFPAKVLITGPEQ